MLKSVLLHMTFSISKLEAKISMYVQFVSLERIELHDTTASIQPVHTILRFAKYECKDEIATFFFFTLDSSLASFYLRKISNSQ